MCGRYYVDDETSREIEKLVRALDRKLVKNGDIRPSQGAPVLLGQKDHLEAREMQWGFPRFDGKGLLINARAESALEKKSFQESIWNRRCVIPAKGFYEWNQHREKFSYEREEVPILFMAGFYKQFEGQERFVILTTQANLSVSSVHDRMPLILENQELEDWVLDNGAVEYFLHKTPVFLKSGTEYEQMHLF